MKKRIIFLCILFLFFLTVLNAQTKRRQITPPVSGDEIPDNNNSKNFDNFNYGKVSNHFPELKTLTGTVLYSPTGVHTLYDLQSNAVPQTIWQDPLNPANIHAVFMEAHDAGFTNRLTIYLFSNDFGATWTNLGSVPSNVRSGFPSIDGFFNGAAVIADHNGSNGTPTRTKLYYDSGPGIGVFSSIDPGILSSGEPIWPKLVCATGYNIVYVASQNPGFAYTNSVIKINPPGTFSGYLKYEGDIACAYAVSRSSNGTIGHAYCGNFMFGTTGNDAFYRYSTDEGLSWSSPITIWQWNNTDSQGVIRGIDLVFKGNEPFVTFNVSKIDDAGSFFPEEPSSIRVWSPNINGGIPKIIADSSNVPFYPNKGNNSDNFLPLCRPSIGKSSAGNYLVVAFSATTGHYSNADSSSYYSTWLTYTSNSGVSWTDPEKITPETPLRDWRFISVSKSNNLTVNQLTIQMVCQADTSAGSFVSGGSPMGDAELVGIRFTISASAIPSTPVLFSPPNNSNNNLLTPVLDWFSVSNATTYRVQVGNDTIFSTLLIDQSNLNISQFTVPSGILSYNTVYHWRVNATNINGTSQWSPVWHFRTVTFLPPAPALVSPPNNSNESLTTPNLDWNDVPSALSYSVQVASDSNFVAPVVNQTNLLTSNYTVPPSTLLLNTKYYWRVNAANSNGTGPWSTTWNFTTISLPSAPILISPLNNSTGISIAPLLDWNNILNANSYGVQLSTDSNFTVNLINQTNISSSQFQVPSSLLSYNIKYYWRANGVNIAGTGAWSQVWNFTTAPVN